MQVDKSKVFQYIPELVAFTVTDEYRVIADTLGLTEWNPVVWIGRLFTRDEDFGEHRFDNWDEREALEERVIPDLEDRIQQLAAR